MRVVLIGSGISYSASPAMHAAAFRAAGLDWTYELRDVTSEELPAAVAELRRPEAAGANVTIPHKVAVKALLDAVEGDAEAAGAVNTIRIEAGRLLGSNTDVSGIRAALGEVGVDPASGPTVVVLGCGGSARAASVALAGAGVTFVARDPSSSRPAGDILDWQDPEWKARARAADLLLNATPLGRHQEMPLEAEMLPSAGAVIDLVYVRGGTPLTRAALARGLPTADGWSVLLAQGAAAFEAWTGRPAPVEAMRRALMA